jgi:hypothetical protein
MGPAAVVPLRRARRAARNDVPVYFDHASELAHIGLANSLNM